ncbi:hypothetical protein [Clostridium chauvoei]|uniref:Transmembrane protein n=2 Tax=Clostridium chauvoei TaxID=46867 RepID=A0A1U6JPK9_9CLOT|nr:hypothetical protein [Clostridium chauvoei]ATD55937.1 hypothetical protein BTM20_12155 [Clostridium chauvoei]ATD56391.1 hypothetical protein BTM21_00860 [Clostridium chauvoei]MBX7281682.1 hypothetical protein [Clostridium chauvoei]MBX7284202.1 hypothetical protein [Clostridium chauvoei]MBX7286730.1 hypothetical protein [Clostridium chauvoei]
MRIKRALKKEKNRKKLFFLMMLILFVILPTVLYLSKIQSIFIWSYLSIIELLIVLAVLIKANYYKLDFTCSNNKLKMKNGLFLSENLILCDKVKIVHTEKAKDDLEIIIVTTVRFKNKSLRPITKVFLKRYPETGDKYLKLKKLEPEDIYYFQIIKRGGYRKYELLDCIYRNCVRATYTSSAIENIKIARDQIEF